MKGNREQGTGNGEWGMGNGEWGMGNGELRFKASELIGERFAQRSKLYCTKG